MSEKYELNTDKFVRILIEYCFNNVCHDHYFVAKKQYIEKKGNAAGILFLEQAYKKAISLGLTYEMSVGKNLTYSQSQHRDAIWDEVEACYRIKHE